MKVDLFFWFDVEDYVTPESDLALGRLVDIFDRHQIKATFKMVGEKVRGLQRRGHRDILNSLGAHDIGYHTDYHSRPPSIPEYALQCDWVGGTAEFVRRERAGLDTLRQAFGRTPSCYGQPGGSWAPQVYPALRQWGIPVYLDAGPWVGLSGKPHRYCDVLDLLGLEHTLHMGIGGGRARVQSCQAQVLEVAERLRHSGGVISLYAHECEFVTSQFWDAQNFAGGQDTPREQWQPAPLVDSAESESRYQALDELLTAVQAVPEANVVVASQAQVLYPDRARGRSFTPRQIARLCVPMADGITHQHCEDAWLSPAEVYGLVVRLLADRVRNGDWPSHVPFRYYDGPAKPPHVEMASGHLSLDDVFGTCLYESAYLDMHGQMPAEVQVGRTWLSPADFIATIGAVLPGWVAGNEDEAAIVEGCLAQALNVPDHVSWNWVIFPRAFDADPLLEMGKLQAWTLKPASRARV